MRFGQDNEVIIKLLPPDPLHILLGLVNLVVDKLEELYPCEMSDELYPKLHIKKSGEGPGGKFAGPSCKKILKEESLDLLEQILPTYNIAEDFTRFLRSIRNLHVMSVSKQLGDYTTVINEFEEHFYNLFHKYNLNMSLKVHVVSPSLCILF